MEIPRYLGVGLLVAIWRWWFWGAVLDRPGHRPIWLVLAVLCWPGYLIFDALSLVLTALYHTIRLADGLFAWGVVPTPREVRSKVIRWREEREARKVRVRDLIPAGRPGDERSAE